MIYTNTVTDPALMLASGKVSGHSVVNKFGRNSDIDTGTAPEDIWDGGGLYNPPTTNRTHQIASTSVEDTGILMSSGTATSGSDITLIDSTATFIADGVAIGDVILIDTTQDHSIITSIDSETSVTFRVIHHGETVAPGATYRIVTSGGTGASVIHIKQGYDEDGAEHNEFIILNGTTNVPTVAPYYRITRMHIHGTGSNKVNVGNISATADVDTTISAQINTGNGQTLMAFFHVPMGKTGYLTNVYASMNRQSNVSGAMADLSIRTRLWGNGHDGVIVGGYAAVSIEGGDFNKHYNPYYRVSQGTDVWIRCEGVSDNATDISSGFDIILVDNN